MTARCAEAAWPRVALHSSIEVDCAAIMRTSLALARRFQVVVACVATLLLTGIIAANVQAQTVPPPQGHAKSDPSGAIDVWGDVPRPGLITVPELMQLGPITTTWTLHGQSHSVVGVPLEKVLRRAGWDPGVMSKALPPPTSAWATSESWLSLHPTDSSPSSAQPS